MQVAVKDINGKELKQIELPDAIYGLEMKEHLLHQVIKAYHANRRQGTHATKTRSMVRGGGKKPFRQKGTGGARQGSTRAPTHPGGAVAHGPQPRDYTQKINKQARQLALKVALSDKVRHGKFVVVSDFEVTKPNTKHVASALQALNSTHALLSDQRDDDLLFKSARNLRYATAKTSLELNAEDVLRYESFVISEKALEALNNRLGGNVDATV